MKNNGKRNLFRDAAKTLKSLQVFNALHHRYYPTFLTASMLSSFAIRGYYPVLSWLVLEMTNSPLLVGVATASRYVAVLIIGGIAGVIVDRVSRRKVNIVFLTVNTVLTFIMAIVISTSLIQYWHIVVIVLLWGLGGMAFGFVAHYAMIPDIVGKSDLTNAMGLEMMSLYFFGAIGDMATGLLIEGIGFGNCYYLFGATYGMSVLLYFMVRPKESLSSTIRKGSVFRELVYGLKYIRSNQAILAIILIEALYNLLILPTTLGGLIAVFARDVLDVGAAGMGMLLGISGIGGLVASICIASLGNFKHKGWLYIVVTMMKGIALVLLSMSRSYPICLILMVFFGFTDSMYNALANSLTLLITSDEVRGRVMGVKSEVIGALVFGNIGFGALAGSMGSPLAIGVGGGLYALSVVTIIALVPKLRRLE